jgi:hypothetical protein
MPIPNPVSQRSIYCNIIDLTNRKVFMVLHTNPDYLPLVQVTNIFHDLEESNVHRSYMSDAIEDISKACAALELKEAAPPVAGIKLSKFKSYCDLLIF